MKLIVAFRKFFERPYTQMWGRTKGREASPNYIMRDKREAEVTGQKLLKHFGMMQTRRRDLISIVFTDLHCSI